MFGLLRIKDTKHLLAKYVSNYEKKKQMQIISDKNLVNHLLVLKKQLKSNEKDFVFIGFTVELWESCIQLCEVIFTIFKTLKNKKTL